MSLFIGFIGEKFLNISNGHTGILKTENGMKPVEMFFCIHPLPGSIS